MNKQNKQQRPKKMAKKIAKAIVNQTQVQKGKSRQRNVSSMGGPRITNVGRGLRTVGGLVGGLLGSSKLGSSLGAGVSRIFGQGDYAVNSVGSNSLMRGGPPSFGDLSSGFKIRHREYLMDISSSVDFSSQDFPLNPGMSKTFPWLSTLASNFEEYKLNGCIIYLNTTSGASVASTNTALGLWGVVTQYDPSEPSFVTKQQCENYIGCQSSVPSNSLMHGIECKPRATILDKQYVRSGALDVGQDLKFYDWGKTQVFTTGSQNANVIGELWISYDVEFFKPRLPSGGYNAYSDKYYSTGTSAIIPLYGNTGLNYPVNGSNIGTYITLGNVINFPSTSPVGMYLIEVVINFSGLSSISALTVTASEGVAYANYFDNNVNSLELSPSFSQSTFSYTISFMCRKIGSTQGGKVTYSMNGVPAGSTTTVSVIRMNQAFLPTSQVLAEGQPPKLDSNDIAQIKAFLSRTKPVPPVFEEDIIEDKERSPRLRKASAHPATIESYEYLSEVQEELMLKLSKQEELIQTLLDERNLLKRIQE